MSDPTPPRHSARETRLLVVTLAVSVAVLLLLARFRFPERALTDLTPPQPLTRLTRVTAFDELSALLRDLLRQFEGAVIVVGVDSPRGPSAAADGDRRAIGQRDDRTLGARDGQSLAGGDGHAVGHALGLLIRNDLALVPFAVGARVQTVAGAAPQPNAIAARDEERGLAVVRVPGYSAPELSVQPQTTPLDAPGYVAILEPAADGPTIRAEFISRYRAEPHPAWDQPVLAVEGAAIRAQPGALIFALNGRFVGMTLPDPDSARTLIVPAYALMASGTRLANGESVRLIHTGISVQPITPAIAKATGAKAGVVVAAVDRVDRGVATAAAVATGGATSDTGSATATANIEVGDVITAVDGYSIRAPRDWHQALRTIAARKPGASLPVTLAVWRLGKRIDMPVVLPRLDSGSTGAPAGGTTTTATSSSSAATAAAASRTPGLDAIGLTLRSTSDGGGRGGAGVEVIAVRLSSPAARAGLQAGDRITSLPGRTAASAAASAKASAKGGAAASAAAGAAPGAAAINAAYVELASRGALLIAVDRQGMPFVTAIEKP